MGQRAFTAGGAGEDSARPGGLAEGCVAACSSACGCGLRRLPPRREGTQRPREDADPACPDAIPSPAHVRSGRRATAPWLARGKHKDKAERMLLSARAELGSILETEDLSASARLRLQAIDHKLRDAEVEAHEAEEHRGRLLPQQWRQLLTPAESTDAQQANAEELSFLLQNYSTHDSSAEADSHLQMSWQGAPKIPSGRGSLLSEASALSGSSAEPEESPSSKAHGRADTPWGTTPARQSKRTSTLLKMTDVRGLLDQAGTLDFDAIAFAGLPAVAGKPLQVLGQELLEENGDVLEDLQQHGWVEDGDTFRTRLFRFLETIGGLYKKEASYHSCAHAVDVMSTMEWFVQMPFVTDRTTPLDHLMCLLAAAIHDVGHPGTTQMFHVTTMSELAIRYNDKSVLENYHISLAFETMLKPCNSCNWFELLQKNFKQGDSPCVNLQKYMRRGLVAMVLATDMSGHAKHVEKLHEIGVDEEEWLTVATEGREEEFVERKLFLLETVLHAADISSPCKPRAIMLGWTQRVLAEFWSQGDEEIRLGLPVSPLCDRQAGLTTVPKGQLGFVQFLIQPFYAQIAQLIPQAQEATAMMMQNKAFWEDMEKEKATYDEIFPE